jgi:hypothetical protein
MAMIGCPAIEYSKLKTAKVSGPFRLSQSIAARRGHCNVRDGEIPGFSRVSGSNPEDLVDFAVKPG